MSCLFKLGSPRTISLCSKVFTNNAFQSSIRYASSKKLFTEKHEWISIQDSDKTIGRVGISNHAQEALGDIVYVQLPDIGAEYKQFDEVGAIESVKAASELMTPVSGEITTVNTNLEEKPSLVNSNCYEDGWLFEMKLSEQKELDKLMSEEKYNEFLEKTSPTSE